MPVFRLQAFPSKRLSRSTGTSTKVPFIEADTDGDAAFALGLVHAHLRLGQISMARMLAQGRLSEMVGPLAVDVDRGLRTIDYARAGDRIRAAMDPAALLWVQRFVDGINHYQDRTRELPHEFRVLGLKRETWTVDDVFAIGRLAGTDVNWLVWAGLLPLRDRPDWNILWARLVERGNTSVPSFDGAGLAADAEQILSGAGRFGSNSMVLAPARTTTGAALIANDPHLGLFVPNFWAHRRPQVTLLPRGWADGTGACRSSPSGGLPISPGGARICALRRATCST